MKAKEFRSKKYGDQRHLFSDQDQEFIDQMMEEYASQPAVSEEEIENADDRCPKCKSIYIMKHRYDDSYKICMSCKHNWRT